MGEGAHRFELTGEHADHKVVLGTIFTLIANLTSQIALTAVEDGSCSGFRCPIQVPHCLHQTFNCRQGEATKRLSSQDFRPYFGILIIVPARSTSVRLLASAVLCRKVLRGLLLVPLASQLELTII